MPDLIKTTVMAKALDDLGQCFYVVDSDSHFKYWLSKKGWAIVSPEYCRKKMNLWLKSKYCLKLPNQTYADVSVSSPASKNRRVDKSIRKKVLERDGKTCMQCGKSEEDGIELTMHHIRPFSKSGDSSPHNLITLCKECNQKIDDSFVEELYDRIGLIIRTDLSLLRGKLDNKTFRWLLILSDNMMQTRCELI